MKTTTYQVPNSQVQCRGAFNLCRAFAIREAWNTRTKTVGHVHYVCTTELHAKKI